jgi:hypothetical protein
LKEQLNWQSAIENRQCPVSNFSNKSKFLSLFGGVGSGQITFVQAFSAKPDPAQRLRISAER